MAGQPVVYFKQGHPGRFGELLPAALVIVPDRRINSKNSQRMAPRRTDRLSVSPRHRRCSHFWHLVPATVEPQYIRLLTFCQPRHQCLARSAGRYLWKVVTMNALGYPAMLIFFAYLVDARTRRRIAGRSRGGYLTAATVRRRESVGVGAARSPSRRTSVPRGTLAIFLISENATLALPINAMHPNDGQEHINYHFRVHIQAPKPILELITLS
jgi:hypothetical protein